MADSYRILILGASYGSLLATKLALAGHHTTLVCLPAERDLINRDGVVVRMPVKDRDGLVEVRSVGLPGRIDAAAPDALDLGQFDLVGLAMQEPQYRSPGVRELLDKNPRFKPLAPSDADLRDRQPLVYSCAHHLVAYLIETAGIEKLRLFLQAMGRGNLFALAFRSTYGFSPQELEARWMRTIRSA